MSMKSPFAGLRSAFYELKNMRSNGFKIFSVCAVAAIPLIYAGLFLLAFLDPYGSLNQVPAAVVNLDQGALVSEEDRNIGQELCDELVENNENAEPGEASGYDWHFVKSESEARQGLEDATYYMEVVIPKNFTKAIASADSDYPEKAELQVYFNPSTNLIAQTVGSSMVTKIKAELNEKVQQSYFDNIFVSIGEAADGMQTAVDGSSDLLDGLNDAKDGSDKITVNLGKLADGAGDLSDGLGKLNKGMSSLNDGTGDLKDGAGDLKGGTSQLKKGAKDLAKGVGELDSGAKTLSAGAAQLQKDGTSAIAAGASQLNEGTKDLPSQEQVDQAKAGSQAIGQGFKGLGQAIDQLSAGIGSSDSTSQQTLNGGMNAIAAGIGSKSDTGATTLYGGTNQLLAGIGASDDAPTAGTLNGGLNGISGGLGQVSNGLSTMKDSLQQVQQGAGNYEAAIQAMASVMTDDQKQALGAAGVDVNALAQAAKSGQLSKGIGAAAGSIGSADTDGTLLNGVAAVSKGASRVKDGLGQVKDGVKGTQQGLEQLSDGVTGVKGGLAAVKGGLGTATDTDATTLYGGVNQLSASYDQLSSQLMPLVESSPQLRAAIVQLSDGATAVDKNMQDLSQGAGDLADGTGTLKKNVGTAKDGAKDGTICGAANALDAGAGQLVAGVKTLAAGVVKLADGSKDAKKGAATIADGADKLHDGSATLTEGLGTAADGAGELHDGLADGVQEMKDNTKNSDQKSEMMSAPVTANGKQHTGEKITEVANYGTGFAPYFIGLGMWVGCLMITFLLRTLNNRILMSNSSSLSAVLSSYLPMAFVSLIQVVILMLFIQFVLGFNVNYVPQYYLFGLLTALAFMAIIQFFRAAFGTAGMVIIVILLMIQLCTAAGTFPIESELPVFNILNPMLPMTYVVKGFRMAMCGLDASYMIQPALVLAAFTVVFLGLTTVVAHSRRRANISMMYPKIEMVH